MWRSEGLLVAFPVMAYGFTAHPYYLGIFQNLNASGVRKMADVTDMVRVKRVCTGLRCRLFHTCWARLTDRSSATMF